jgi:hypothetical protein
VFDRLFVQSFLKQHLERISKPINRASGYAYRLGTFAFQQVNWVSPLR